MGYFLFIRSGYTAEKLSLSEASQPNLSAWAVSAYLSTPIIKDFLNKLVKICYKKEPKLSTPLIGLVENFIYKYLFILWLLVKLIFQETVLPTKQTAFVHEKFLLVTLSRECER